MSNLSALDKTEADVEPKRAKNSLPLVVKVNDVSESATSATSTPAPHGFHAAWSVCATRARASRFRSISGSSTKPQLMHRMTADSGK